jgi:hypothetical protein
VATGLEVGVAFDEEVAGAFELLCHRRILAASLERYCKERRLLGAARPPAQ